MEIKKETRDEASLRKLKEKKEVEYGKRILIANKKVDYIRNTLNGRYYLSRYNMMAEQLISGIIKESIDGCLKTKEVLINEAALMKMQAIISLRNAHFAKEDLIKEFNFSEENILEIEKDYYDGKILRESYDEEYKRGNKAEFVNSPENK